MNRQRHPAMDLLPVMAAAFPHTFFTDPKQVQPLKVNIHEDLLAALPAGIEPHRARRFLRWYVRRPVYLKALLQNKGRIDLTGAVVQREIPALIREQTQERWEHMRQALKARKNGATSQTATTAKSWPASHQPRPTAPLSPLNLEELYALAVDAKLEVTLKFSNLPTAKSAGQGKMRLMLQTPDGQWVTATIGNKIWNKLVKAAEEGPNWIAALSGTMGERTETGFTLANPGLQVFEKKAKATDTMPETNTPPAPAPPAEPVATPPPLAAPVTITTGAGRATVTVTPRAPWG